MYTTFIKMLFKSKNLFAKGKRTVFDTRLNALIAHKAITMPDN